MVSWTVLFPILGIWEATRAKILSHLSTIGVLECEVGVVPFQVMESVVRRSASIIAGPVVVGEMWFKILLEE